MADATNVTRFKAPGGNNVIPDGYIKTVEKVWLDDYTIAFTNTNTTIDIAVLPENKKVTGIIVEIETTTSQTSGTVSIGYSTDSAVDTFLAPTSLTHNLTRTSISLPSPGVVDTDLATIIAPSAHDGFQAVTTGTATTISVKLNNWTMTSGTLKTKVSYT